MLPAGTDKQHEQEQQSEAHRYRTAGETESFTLLVERPTGDAPDLPDSPAQTKSLATKTEITHVVVAGDTLWDIAERYLGDPFQYPELARLSRIRDPDLIYPGDIIRIIMKP